MHGAGIDLLEIERLERALARQPRLARRFFSAGELAYATAQARPARHLAARFCAKEAVTKALGLRAPRWREVEVVGGGADVDLRLTGATAARARKLDADVRISLTHSRETAAAVAVLA